jgi:hypothetical protein
MQQTMLHWAGLALFLTQREVPVRERGVRALIQQPGSAGQAKLEIRKEPRG